ncbi:hypothetical protein ACU4GH_22605 [Bradyrhizobium betae]
MIFRFSSAIAGIGLSFLLAGCGTSLWTVAKDDYVPDEYDGALMSYALAKGEVSVSAEFTGNKLTLSSDGKVTATPDYNEMYRLAYTHHSLSDDEIDITLENGLVKSLTSTTEDKSVAVVQGVTALLTQVASTKADLLKINTLLPEKKAEEPKPICTDFKAVFRKDITNDRSMGGPNYTQIGDPDCKIEFTVTSTIKSRRFEVAGFTAKPATVDDLSSFCRRAFCFRKAAVYQVTATAKLYKAGVYRDITAGPLTFEVLAPTRDLAYVRFDRRAFVQNKTSVTFTNGVLTGFSAKNPSEVVGALRLPTELLKGVSAAIVLN